MADDNWYYAQNNQQLGPVTLEALRNMLVTGQVHGSDLVWTQGMPQWLPARSVPEVASVLANVGAGGAAGVAGMGAAPQGQYAPQAGYAPPQGPLGYGVQQSYYQQQYQGYNVEYAGFWLRFCAAFIDGLILGIPFFLLGLLNDVMFPPTTNAQGFPVPSGINVAIGLILGLGQIVAYWLYFAMQESGTHQATLGKRAIGIKVVDLGGGPVGFAQATGRHFAKILSGCILYIGFIMAAFTEKKQGLHDMMANTLVVKK